MNTAINCDQGGQNCSRECTCDIITVPDGSFVQAWNQGEMSFNRRKLSYAEAVQTIEQLNLDMIRFKLCQSKDGPMWNEEKAISVEIEYRRFLILNFMFPERSMAPSLEVDTFWHYHILDTRKYRDDQCRIFGFLLEHCPYLGMIGENGQAELQKAGDTMLDTYFEVFGEEAPEDIWWRRQVNTQKWVLVVVPPPQVHARNVIHPQNALAVMFVRSYAVVKCYPS